MTKKNERTRWNCKSGLLHRVFSTVLGTLAICGLLSPPAVMAGDNLDIAAAKKQLDLELNGDYPHLDALYKDLHAHPETAMRERRTAAVLAAEMRKLGFTVTEHIANTGVVAIYRNGDGPVVMVRTELDGLPMEEKTGLPYASRVRDNR